MKPVALIIVNYNGGSLLLETLTSLFDHTNQELFDLFLVDNGSTDGSQTQALKEFPQIKLLQSKENLGFGRGNNIALESVLASQKYKYALLSNNDMYYTGGWLERLINKFEHLSTEDDESSKPLAGINPAIIFADKFYKTKLYSFNKDIFIDASDSRFWKSDLHRRIFDTGEFPKNYKLNFENREFYKLTEDSIDVYMSVKELENDNFVVNFWDPKLNGIEVKLLNRKIKQPRSVSLMKKITYFLTRKLNHAVKGVELKDEEISDTQNPLELINSCGGFFNGKDLPVDYLYAQPVSQLPEEPIVVDYLHAACMLVRTDMLAEVGLFSEDIFMYYEDADLGLRIREAGYKLMAVPDIKVYHREGGSKSELTEKFMQESEKIFRSRWLSN